jgi:hypothetical protein
MARTIAALPAGTRITDYFSLGVITKAFPPTLTLFAGLADASSLCEYLTTHRSGSVIRWRYGRELARGRTRDGKSIAPTDRENLWCLRGALIPAN